MNSKNTAARAENRHAPRRTTDLEAIVTFAGSDGTLEKDIASVTTVSRTGIGFTLSRPCAVGRLVTMVLEMPREMRAYDEDAELYLVLALVQNCYKSNAGGEDTYHIGAALIGKKGPESFQADPCQNFRIDGMGENGLWKVVEVKHAFKAREHQRYWKQLKVTLTLFKNKTKTITKEATVTLDIAAKGASVVSDLDAEVGDKVKFICKEFNFFSLAVVRNCKKSKSGNRLHLEFIDAIFPTESVPREIARGGANASSAKGV